MARFRLVAALMLVSIPVAASAQEDIVLTGTAICQKLEAATVYEPRRTYEGVMFSFIDGTTFTPCAADQRCELSANPETLDLESREGAWGRHQTAWTGWGYYRIRFDGRIGRRAACLLGRGDFYEVIRVRSAIPLPDQRPAR